jgi:undecaprenyl-diphosphatase
MPILHAIVLGLTQGLSEFLPISSSGHLILVPWLFGWHDFDTNAIQKAFDVALHLGTLVAAVAYFRHELVVYIRDGVKAIRDKEMRQSPEGRLPWLLVASALPAGLVGAALETKIDDKLGKVGLIAGSLILFGLVLLWADRLTGDRRVEGFTPKDALVIGAAQVLSLNPGTSRSGITITAARYQGFTRDSAARISFLMALPVTAGAVVLKMAKLAKDGVPHGMGSAMVIGVITAAISGWLAVWGTIRLVRTRSFTPFVIYRVLAGVTVFILLATHFR